MKFPSELFLSFVFSSFCHNLVFMFRVASTLFGSSTPEAESSFKSVYPSESPRLFLKKLQVKLYASLTIVFHMASLCLRTP